MKRIIYIDGHHWGGMAAEAVADDEAETMTVAELIAQLSEFPGDCPVVLGDAYTSHTCNRVR